MDAPSAKSQISQLRRTLKSLQKKLKEKDSLLLTYEQSAQPHEQYEEGDVSSVTSVKSHMSVLSLRGGQKQATPVLSSRASPRVSSLDRDEQHVLLEQARQQVDLLRSQLEQTRSQAGLREEEKLRSLKKTNASLEQAYRQAKERASQLSVQITSLTLAANNTNNSPYSDPSQPASESGGRSGLGLGLLTELKLSDSGSESKEDCVVLDLSITIPSSISSNERGQGLRQAGSSAIADLEQTCRRGLSRMLQLPQEWIEIKSQPSQNSQNQNVILARIQNKSLIGLFQDLGLPASSAVTLATMRSSHPYRIHPNNDSTFTAFPYTHSPDSHLSFSLSLSLSVSLSLS